MSITLEIPKFPKLDCGSDGKLNKKDIDAYLKNLARITNRLNISAIDLNDECQVAIVTAAIAIEELTKKTLDPVVTPPFIDLKSKELEAKYKARELSKDIEEYIKKKIVDIILTLARTLGVPNPFTAPIPFIGTTVDGYDPVVADMFTKEGQKKVKAAIQNDIETVKAFFKDVESTFNGDLGIKSPDLESEELWHKVKNWFNQLINDFIGAVAEGIAKIVKSIPIIGKPIYDLVLSSIDPTVVVEKSFDQMVKEYKSKIKVAKDDFLSGKMTEDIGEKLLQEAIDKILKIQIPLLGSVGDYVDVDIKNKDIIIPEFDFHEVEDAFKELIQKARRFFKGGLLVKIYEIIDKAPSFIINQFPIVGTIFKTLKKVVDILSGKNPLTECDVLNIIVPTIFGLSVLIENLMPDCVDIVFTE